MAAKAEPESASAASLAGCSLLLLLLLLSAVSVSSAPLSSPLVPTPQKSYAGHTLLSAWPQNEAERTLLRREVLGHDCQFFKEPRPGQGGLRSADFLCPPSRDGSRRLRERLREAGLEHVVAVEDYGKIVLHGGKEKVRWPWEEDRNLPGYSVKETDVRAKRKERSVPQEEEDGRLSFDEYPRYDTIISYLEGVAKKYPAFVKITDIGTSHEGRKIKLVKVGRSPLKDKTRAVWIDAGIHAREWIAPITGLYLIDQLTREFALADNRDLAQKDLLNIDYYIAPLLNPDGYEYTHTHERLWRKNRAPAPPEANSECIGVDLNRNWDVVGFGVGADDNPCSNVYSGTKANSEPEVMAASKAILELKDRIRVSLSLHSYGQLWLTSWGYKSQLPVDNDKMVSLGRRATEAMEKVNGRKYTVGAAGAIFYPAGGASDDFAKAKAHIPYAVTLELPADSTYGFELPSSQILGVGREVWSSLAVLAEAARSHPLGPDPALSKERARDRLMRLKGRADDNGKDKDEVM